jgi:hypothetical protein
LHIFPFFLVDFPWVFFSFIFLPLTLVSYFFELIYHSFKLIHQCFELVHHYFVCNLLFLIGLSLLLWISLSMLLFQPSSWPNAIHRAQLVNVTLNLICYYCFKLDSPLLIWAKFVAIIVSSSIYNFCYFELDLSPLFWISYIIISLRFSYQLLPMLLCSLFVIVASS